MVDLTRAEPPAGPPRMALADGPLLIWLQEPGLPQTYQTKILPNTWAVLIGSRPPPSPRLGS